MAARIPRTLQRQRNCARPMHPVRIWVRTALSALYSLVWSKSRRFKGSWPSSLALNLAFHLFSQCAYALLRGASASTTVRLPMLTHSRASLSHILTHWLRVLAGVGAAVLRLLPLFPWSLRAILSQAVRISCAWLDSSRRWWKQATSLSKCMSKGGTCASVSSF